MTTLAELKALGEPVRYELGTTFDDDNETIPAAFIESDGEWIHYSDVAALLRAKPALIAIAEASTTLRKLHRAYMEGPSFYTQSAYEGAQLILDAAIARLTGQGDGGGA